MKKEEFEKIRDNPFNIDNQQLFFTFVESVVGDRRIVRNTDALMLEQYVNAPDSRWYYQQARNVIEKVLQREKTS